jgi:riboflavin-specific deaminase-like protein
VRQLLPEPDGTPDLLALYTDVVRPPQGGRPWVLVNGVTSTDGATAVDGRTADLGGPADHTVFHLIRSAADAILVGAGTARAEGYRPPRAPAGEAAEHRAARGQATRPRLAVVSRRIDLDPALAFLHDDPPPWLITTEQPPVEAMAAVEGLVEPLQVGGDEVDLVAALAGLGRRGVGVVLSEGGPTLNAALAAADLIDELCLSIAPVVVGGATDRIVGPRPVLPELQGYRIAHLLEADGLLLLRYLRAR